LLNFAKKEKYRSKVMLQGFNCQNWERKKKKKKKRAKFVRFLYMVFSCVGRKYRRLIKDLYKLYLIL
jgi:hypothetical protein